MASVQPRSILLPSPTRTHADEWPARFAPASPAMVSTPHEERRRTSITIEDRPRIVARPVVDGSRRDRRRSSTVSTPAPFPQPRRSLDASEDAPSLGRKASTGSVFATLFSGRKKKISKDDSSNSRMGREASMESLEGEVVESHGEMMPLQAARKRAMSAVPSVTETNPAPTRLAAPAPPVRRVSESDASLVQPHRPRPPMLHLQTSPLQTTFPSQQQPRRRSSTRLASPSVASASSRRTSSRPTSPATPGFAAFQGFITGPRDPAQANSYASTSSPRSPMYVPEPFRSSTSQFPRIPAPFSLTIREGDDKLPDGPSELSSASTLDPAQFEDGSDGESWLDKLAPMIALSTHSPAAASPAFVDASEPRTPVLGDEAGDRVSITCDAAPSIAHSESGPPPTFKVIPATPIVPPEASPVAAQETSAGDSKQRKKRDSVVVVPVNPMRPRTLASLLDKDTTGPKEPSMLIAKEDDKATTLGAVSLLGSEVFKTGSSDSADDESPDSSPGISPVRSPSAESLQRNTAPLRLAHPPRLISPTATSRPAHSTLSMSSSLQSSRALTLSTSSTLASSLDSLDTMDLDDVDSALGTMLASLSTRPSLADRLRFDEPSLGASPQLQRKAQEMELSALGFAPQHTPEPSTRDFFPPPTFHSDINLFDRARPDGVYRTSSDDDDDDDDDTHDSETESIFSDIDDLGSVSIAVVQKQGQAVFASPRTLSIGDSAVERLC
ncbi:hypothetical protein NliqN6_1378 [Naganishia liquefaciens]|uniref:Uncharacterized protein n=1 Tax=Naganishia liquefaciens TaxID=104408 RepID=A0A8H3TPI3_9TREE|nr:hypothetical protein NliqN6_1378 [Naganishia liquefaciens]